MEREKLEKILKFVEKHSQVDAVYIGKPLVDDYGKDPVIYLYIKDFKNFEDPDFEFAVSDLDCEVQEHMMFETAVSPRIAKENGLFIELLYERKYSKN